MSGTGYGLTEEEKAELWRLISSTISTEGREFFVFGSRATGTARKYSDVDLAIGGRGVSSIERAELEDAFEESRIPYIIDVVEVSDMAPEFKEFALKVVMPIGGSIEQVA